MTIAFRMGPRLPLTVVAASLTVALLSVGGPANQHAVRAYIMKEPSSTYRVTREDKGHGVRVVARAVGQDGVGVDAASRPIVIRR